MIAKLLIALLLFAPSIYAKTVVISDLDETLRISQTHNYAVSLGAIIRGVKPFRAMQYIFNDLKQLEDIEFIYISASYHRFYNGQKWVAKHNFPYGPVYQKPKLTTPNGTFKTGLLERLWNEGKIQAHDHVLFFGDNSSHDEDAYLEFKNNHQLSGDIFIRDIKVKATYVSDLFEQERMEGISYFLSESDLLLSPLNNFLTPKTENFINNQFSKRLGIVKTQLKYLKRKLTKKLCPRYFSFFNISCKVAVSRESSKIVNNYFH